MKYGNTRLMKNQSKKPRNKYWSATVGQKSNALDLEQGVFTWCNPKRIALSLRASAKKSSRKKGEPISVSNVHA